jgi:hypothetical protein
VDEADTNFLEKAAMADKKAVLGKAVTVFEWNLTHFVDTFDECANDEKCHIFYHHVQKMGGTHIATILFPFFGKYGIQWCRDWWWHCLVLQWKDNESLLLK